MKCMSCEKEVDPKWSHAIEINVCPYCGSSIMAEHLKNLLASLRTTMEELQAYPEQLSDYLLSNFDFIKTDSPLLSGYCPKQSASVPSHSTSTKGEKSVVKIKTDAGEEEVEVQKLQSDEETSKFFKRADIAKVSNKTEHLKSLVQQIKKGTADGSGISNEVLQADPEVIEQMENAILSEGSSQIASALAVSEDDDIPAAVLAMAGNSKGGGKNAADLLKLQNLYGKVDQSRKNFESGANRGKGGFSRSS